MAVKQISSIVSSRWLKGQIPNNLKKLCIIDASWGLKKSGLEPYRKEHIPGALFFDLNRCVNPLRQLPRNLPNPSCFMEYAQTLGINRDTHLVLYDRGNMLPSSRAWWNFKAYGQKNVSVLDGGLAKWMKEGLPIQSGPMSLPSQQGDFEVEIRNELITNYEGIQKMLQNKSHQIIDARSPEHFIGHESEPTKPTLMAYEGLDLLPLDRQRHCGHIPGSVNLPEDNLLDPTIKCLLPKEKLLKEFQSAGVDISKPMATLCYNGNAACLLALAASVCGQDRVAVYYGSWTEYGYRTGPEGVVTISGNSNADGG